MAEIKLTIDLLKGDGIVVGSAPKSVEQSRNPREFPQLETTFTLEDGTIEAEKETMRTLSEQHMDESRIRRRKRQSQQQKKNTTRKKRRTTTSRKVKTASEQQS